MASSVSSQSATSLINRLQQQEAVAWQELVEIYSPLIFHWCRQCQLDSADSADVMQEVFASVSQAIHGYQKRPQGTFRGWLWQITQNKIRDFFRRNQRQFNGAGGTAAQLELNQAIDPFGDESEPATSQLQIKELLHRALKLIENDFQPQTWRAFWRSTIDGKSSTELVKELSMSPNSIRQAKSRVLRRLREQLGDL